MKTIKPYTGFEQGPIRPPSEAESLLIRITRNCPWNRCTFCPVYKGSSFSLRPVEHVIRDIDSVRAYVVVLISARKDNIQVSSTALSNVPGIEGGEDMGALQAAYHFIAGGMKSIFLQDGNSLIIKPDDFIRILRHLQSSFPMVERITSYARSHTVARISDEHLAEMARSGLNRIHIGMESGSNQVLTRVKKGVTKATHILAGQKIKRAGMELSEYYMPGLGGRTLTREHALETADALNQINPDFIRMRSLALPGKAPLTAEYKAGKFDKMGEVETARELLLFLETLDGITSTIRSDHVLNLFPEIDGTYPQDKERLTAHLRKFLELDPYDQMLFCVGRRTRRIFQLEELHDPASRSEIEELCRNYEITPENMDKAISSIMCRYI